MPADHGDDDVGQKGDDEIALMKVEELDADRNDGDENRRSQTLAVNRRIISYD